MRGNRVNFNMSYFCRIGHQILTREFPGPSIAKSVETYDRHMTDIDSYVLGHEARQSPKSPDIGQHASFFVLQYTRNESGVSGKKK